jgi:hypothetical protein
MCLRFVISFAALWMMVGCSSSRLVQQRSGLQQLSWINGSWKGMHQGKAFYEVYKVINDSVLKITSYEWNGTDSSKSSNTYIRKVHGDFYLGDSLNWKVTAITDSSIMMLPHYKASNEIYWVRKDKDHWDAVLRSKRGEVLYRMERFSMGR